MTKAVMRFHLKRLTREYEEEHQKRIPHCDFLERSDRKVERLHRQIKELESRLKK